MNGSLIVTTNFIGRYLCFEYNSGKNSKLKIANNENNREYAKKTNKFNNTA